MVRCSGAYGDDRVGKKGQGRVGLAVREKITLAVVRPSEFINEGLLKVTLKLGGRHSVLTFVVIYGPTKSIRGGGENRSFWTELNGAMKEVPNHEQLFVVIESGEM